MSNKPVAWAYIKDGEFWDAIHPDEHAQEEGSYTIPLYTHPVKEHFEDEPQAEELHEIMQSNAELTDEEILDLCPPNHSDMMNEAYTIEFARAILRKAQEK